MELTLEQALEQIKIILEFYKGTFKEHEYLTNCYNKILENIKINKSDE